MVAAFGSVQRPRAAGPVGSRARTLEGSRQASSRKLFG
jgi:hypothetical protein